MRKTLLRLVVVAGFVATIGQVGFPSLAQAQAWYESPSYQAIIPIRHRSGNTRTYIVEGLPGSK